MAVLANPLLVSVDEYLKSSYYPDMEYVDGVLVERSVPANVHSLLQMILIEYLGRYRKAFGFLSLPEARTQIIERARYRIPDVMLCPAPLSAGKVVTGTPWAVIEILSPEDRMPVQLERFRDYKRIGVPHVVLLDPEQFIAFRFDEGSLLQTRFTSLDLPTGSLPFDTESLFAQLREETNEASASAL